MAGSRTRSSAGRSSDEKRAIATALSSGSEVPSTTVMLSEQPSFDMLVLGCGGGPAENDLSAYWVKAAEQAWSDGFISVDGGSCLGALIRLLDSHPDAFRDFLDQQPTTTTQQASSGSSGASHLHARAAASPTSTLLKAGQIYDMLQAFLITHAHWDHISCVEATYNESRRCDFGYAQGALLHISLTHDFHTRQGLVLSSSSGSSKQKTVYGSKQTISNLSSAMNGGLWPILGSYEAANGVPYVWRDMSFGQDTIKPVKGLSASIMPLSHGNHHQGTSYESSAFFLQNDTTNKSLLVFGDVEPDSVSGLSLNREIWNEAAKRISEARLSAMLIECSYCSSRPKKQLYGHLSPVYIAEELRVLASLLLPQSGQDSTDLKGRLRGLTVCIVHVKDPISMAEVEELPHGTPLETEEAATNAFAAPATKRTRTTPASSTVSTPSRRTRSSSSRSSLVPFPTQQEQRTVSVNTSLPEGIKTKIFNELQDLESRDQLGVRYLMLEQGMRIAF